MNDTTSVRSGLSGHPPGLTTLFFTEMWERFSYYGMRALLILFLTASAAAGGLGLDTKEAARIYGLYTAGVYFMAIPGGWVADRLLGQRRAVLWGGILIAAGHYSLALNVRPFFFAGLVLIVLGTGLLKPNISVMVGQLYPPGDARRDAGFSIFYMGINIGAFVSPLICGYLGQKVGWHWGFGAAAVGMTLGIVQYVLGARRLGDAGQLRAKPDNAPLLWAGLAGALVAMGVVLYVAGKWAEGALLVGLAVAGGGWFVHQHFTPIESRRIGAVFILFLFSALFWSGFEQAGSSLNLFGERFTDLSVPETLKGPIRSLTGREVQEFPSTWFQSVNAIFIILLAPVFAWLWVRLGTREPSSPAKFAYGLIAIGISFGLIAIAAHLSGPEGHRVSPMWLIVLYLLHTIGELCLSPVGLSTVTKLAPAKVQGQMMGVWFLSLSLGNLIGGVVAGFFESFPLPKLFGAVGLTMTASALLLALLVKPIRRLMEGVH